MLTKSGAPARRDTLPLHFGYTEYPNVCPTSLSSLVQTYREVENLVGDGKLGVTFPNLQCAKKPNDARGFARIEPELRPCRYSTDL
jgi:hypothetical protein